MPPTEGCLCAVIEAQSTCRGKILREMVGQLSCEPELQVQIAWLPTRGLWGCNGTCQCRTLPLPAVFPYKALLVREACCSRMYFAAMILVGLSVPCATCALQLLVPHDILTCYLRVAICHGLLRQACARASLPGCTCHIILL
jgi:hypothetical protein